MKKLLLFGIFALMGLGLYAQDTISTQPAFTNNNGASAISFEIDAVSATKIVGISNAYNTGVTSTDVWIRVGGVGGSPTAALSVTAANGWVLHQSGVSVTGNGGIPAWVQNLNPILVPAGTKVGVVLTGSMGYFTATGAPVVSFPGSFATLNAGGPTTGFGGAVPTLANRPRGFVGSVALELDLLGGCANAFTNVFTDSILSSSARVNWTPGTGNSSFWLEYGLAGFTPGSGTKISGTYPGTQPPVILTGLSVNTDYDYYIGEICNSGADSIYAVSPYQFKTTKLCAPVTNLAVTNVLSTTADVSWVHAGGANSYTVYYGAGLSQSATSSPVTLTGLTPTTAYNVYVVADCGTTNGVSDSTGPASFTTLCSIYTTPYSEDFTTWPPSCYTFTKTGTWDWDQDAAGYARARFWSFSTGVATMKSPPISITQEAQVKFKWAHLYNSSYPDDRVILRGHLVGSSQWDTLIDLVGPTFNSPNSGSTTPPPSASDFISELFYLDSATYVGQIAEFEFIALTDFGPHAFVDDFVVENIPACPEPTAVTISNLSSTTATINFSSSGNSFPMEWGPVGFNQGTGAQDTAAASGHTITGLLPNTEYDIYILNDCSGAGNGLSVWAGPYTFRTLCSGFAEGYFENFDVFTSNTKNPCWYDFAVGGVNNVYAYATPTWSNVQAFSTPNVYYWYNNSATNSYIVTPELLGLDGDTTQIRFRMAHNYFTATPIPVYIGTMSDRANASTIVWVDTITPAQYVWNEYTVMFDNVPAGHKFAVFGRGNSPTFSEVDLDNFYFEGIPACPPPASANAQATSSTTASVSWPGSGSAYEIEYGPVGFTQGTGSTISVTASPYAISGLFPNTCYDVYVRQDCGATGTSPWFGPVTFCTPCVASTMPYTESFTNWPPNCFTLTKTGSWDWDQDPAGYARARFWSFSSGSATMRTSSVTINQKAQVKFKWAHQYQTFYPDDRVLLRAHVLGSSQWDTLIDMVGPTFNSPNSGATTPPASASDFVSELFYLDSTKYVGQTAEFEFVAFTDFGPHAFIDDFVVEAVPSCPDPTQVSISSIQGFQANVNWSSAGGSQFVIEYGPQGFGQGSGMMDTVSTSPATLTGLTPVTCYDVYIKALCGSNGTSSWVGPISFCTAVSCPAPTALTLQSAGLSSATMSWTTGSASSWNYVNVPGGQTPGAGTVVYGASNPTTVTGLIPGTAYSFFVRDSCGPGDISAWTGPLNYVTPLCDTSQQCDYTVNMFDSFGDGWNGFVFSIEVGGVTFYQIGSSFTTGSSATATFKACNGYPVTVKVVNGGTYPTEVSFDIVNSLGVTVLSGSSFNSTSTGTTVGTFTPNCLPISCPAPTALSSANVNLTTANLSWTATNTNNQVSYGVSPIAPNAGTIVGVTGSTHSLTGLSANTTYAYYVRSICGVGDTSFWAGPEFFTTPLCDTSQQCEFTLNMMDSFGDGWNGFEVGFEVGGILFEQLGSSFTTGSSASATFKACSNFPVTVKVLSTGTYPTEVSFDLLDDQGNVILSGSSFSSASLGMTVGTFTPNCAPAPCPSPINFTATPNNVGCDNIVLTWTSDPGTLSSGMIWDVAGFDPALTGNVVANAQSPQSITGLTPGTAYDFYLIDSCALGLSAPVFNSTTTAVAPMPTIAFSQSQTATTATNATVNFDASASTNYTSITWVFGDGTPNGTNAVENHVYTQNQSYTVTLTLTNGCGTVDSTFTVTVAGIGINETALSRSLNIFPNPTDGAFTVNFNLSKDQDVSIKVIDALGRSVLLKELGKVNGAQSIGLDLSNNASGIYMVQIVSEEGTITRRITLQSK